MAAVSGAVAFVILLSFPKVCTVVAHLPPRVEGGIPAIPSAYQGRYMVGGEVHSLEKYRGTQWPWWDCITVLL